MKKKSFKTAQIVVWVNPEIKDWYDSRANSRGQTTAEFVRSLLADYKDSNGLLLAR